VIRESAPIQPRVSPLQRIVSVALILGLLFYLGYSITEGTTNSRFLQVGAAVGVLVYLATFIDILIGIAFLIVCIGLGPEVSMAGLRDLRLEDFIVPALLLSWLTRSAQRREPFVHSPIARPALLYLTVMLISTFMGLGSGTTRPTMAIAMVGKYIEYYLIYLILLNNIRTREELKGIAIFALMVGLISAITSSDRLFETDDQRSRLSGPLGETANIYGGYLILHLGIALGFLLHGRAPGSRFLLVVLLIIIGGAMLRTYSRTSYAAFLLAALAFGVLKDPRVLLFMVLVSLLLPFIPDTVLSRMESIGQLASERGSSSWNARVYAWEGVMERLAGPALLLGYGVGSVRLGDIDSEYFRILADTGVLGLGCLVWILFRIGRQANATYNALPPGTPEKGFAAGFLIAFMAIVVHAIAATSLTSIRSMEAFVVFAGLSGCLAHHLRDWNLVAAPASLPPAPFPAARPVRL
jgi:hypothetical protein